MMRRLPLLLALLLGWAGAALATPADSPSADAERAKLKGVVERLAKERKALKKALGKERGLLGDLQRLDRALAENRERREGIEKRRNKALAELPVVKARLKKAKREMALEKKRLAGQVRMIYGLGGRGALKVALSQDSASDLSQAMHYFGYLIRARDQRFDAFRESVSALDQAKRDRQQLAEQLRNLADSLAKEEAAYKEKRQGRAKLLARVQKETGLRSRKVAELKQARSALEQLVADLETGLAEVKIAALTEEKITRRRGELLRPVGGLYKSKKPGVFFPVKPNQPVNAVFRGHVVFADWFKGFGRFIILDHGDRVYTLYGHNSRLKVALGDWVEEGETIAESGDTGSLLGHGLYFEVRRNGRSVNAKRWLASR